MENFSVDKSLEDLIKEERRKETRSQKIVKPAAPKPNSKSSPPKAPHHPKSRNFHEENSSNLSSVQVFNLPANISMNDVQVLFSNCGEIDKINTYWIPKLGNKFNARIFYKSLEGAKKAVEVYHQAKLDNQTLILHLKNE